MLSPSEIESLSIVPAPSAIWSLFESRLLWVGVGPLKPNSFKWGSFLGLPEEAVAPQLMTARILLQAKTLLAVSDATDTYQSQCQQEKDSKLHDATSAGCRWGGAGRRLSRAHFSFLECLS